MLEGRMERHLHIEDNRFKRITLKSLFCYMNISNTLDEITLNHLILAENGDEKDEDEDEDEKGKEEVKEGDEDWDDEDEAEDETKV